MNDIALQKAEVHASIRGKTSRLSVLWFQTLSNGKKSISPIVKKPIESMSAKKHNRHCKVLHFVTLVLSEEQKENELWLPINQSHWLNQARIECSGCFGLGQYEPSSANIAEYKKLLTRSLSCGWPSFWCVGAFDFNLVTFSHYQNHNDSDTTCTLCSMDVLFISIRLLGSDMCRAQTDNAHVGDRLSEGAS